MRDLGVDSTRALGEAFGARGGVHNCSYDRRDRSVPSFACQPLKKSLFPEEPIRFVVRAEPRATQGQCWGRSRTDLFGRLARRCRALRQPTWYRGDLREPCIPESQAEEQPASSPSSSSSRPRPIHRAGFGAAAHRVRSAGLPRGWPRSLCAVSPTGNSGAQIR